ncbi:hypothetical protein GUJ93_ZPchr0005g15097 [Zizania palustris]|uniref:Uncharacterized protein n=1 Tax=Zizania palustris TaxID=103762 RepID=A0A8J5W040_ZIZPA|nr:hypothetical protein GUJ93_ZPchr0005g15097 [Zizania palustris]
MPHLTGSYTVKVAVATVQNGAESDFACLLSFPAAAVARNGSESGNRTAAAVFDGGRCVDANAALVCTDQRAKLGGGNGGAEDSAAVEDDEGCRGIKKTNRKKKAPLHSGYKSTILSGIWSVYPLTQIPEFCTVNDWLDIDGEASWSMSVIKTDLPAGGCLVEPGSCPRRLVARQR